MLNLKNLHIDIIPPLLYNGSISKGDKVEIMNNSEEYKRLQQRESELTYTIVELLKEENNINAKLFLARKEYRDVCDQGLDEKEGELADVVVDLLRQQNDVSAKLFIARREFRDVTDQLSELDMQEQNSDDLLEDVQLEDKGM